VMRTTETMQPWTLFGSKHTVGPWNNKKRNISVSDHSPVLSRFCIHKL